MLVSLCCCRREPIGSAAPYRARWTPSACASRSAPTRRHVPPASVDPAAPAAAVAFVVGALLAAIAFPSAAYARKLFIRDITVERACLATSASAVRAIITEQIPRDVLAR